MTEKLNFAEFIRSVAERESRTRKPDFKIPSWRKIKKRDLLDVWSGRLNGVVVPSRSEAGEWVYRKLVGTSPFDPFASGIDDLNRETASKVLREGWGEFKIYATQYSIVGDKKASRNLFVYNGHEFPAEPEKMWSGHAAKIQSCWSAGEAAFHRDGVPADTTGYGVSWLSRVYVEIRASKGDSSPLYVDAVVLRALLEAFEHEASLFTGAYTMLNGEIFPFVLLGIRQNGDLRLGALMAPATDITGFTRRPEHTSAELNFSLPDDGETT